MSGYSDKELLDFFHNTDTRHYGFNLLVNKYKERLYWHVRKIVIDHDDTDDVLQNTFIKVWKGLEGFREESVLYTWLYRIATNESITFLKQKRTKYFLPLVDVEKDLSRKLEADPYFNGNDIQLKLEKAILQLPEKQRIVFNMRYHDETPYEEMSEILGTSVGALKASFHHAMKKVEEYLTRD